MILGQKTSQSPPAADHQATEQEDPILIHRPPPKPASSKSAIAAEGRISLDVVVTDEAGKPMTGLAPWDFKLLDNNKPQKILSFHSYDGAAVMPNPPVEVLLLMDTANLPLQQVAFVRDQLEQFLRQNGGHLRQPLSLILLEDGGIRVQAHPSVDGNAIAEVARSIKVNIGYINPAMGGGGYVERFQLSVKQMLTIAENEAGKPGRKLLIWIGPGWPLLNRPSDGYTEREQKLNFNGIVALSTRLREARVAVYSVAPISTDSVRGSRQYQGFLDGVRTFRQAQAGNLALKVLATQTGGQILGPSNDLVSQLNECIADANAFYRISFNPPAAAQADEYHDLKIQVGRPGVTIRTTTGYYNQP